MNVRFKEIVKCKLIGRYTTKPDMLVWRLGYGYGKERLGLELMLGCVWYSLDYV